VACSSAGFLPSYFATCCIPWIISRLAGVSSSGPSPAVSLSSLPVKRNLVLSLLGRQIVARGPNFFRAGATLRFIHGVDYGPLQSNGMCLLEFVVH
jgi:hypothetical protein